MHRLLYWNGMTKARNLYALIAVSMVVAIPTIVLSWIGGDTVDAVLIGVVQVSWAGWVVAVARKAARRQTKTSVNSRFASPTALRKGVMIIERTLSLLFCIAGGVTLVKVLGSHFAVYGAFQIVWGMTISAGHLLFALLANPTPEE